MNRLKDSLWAKSIGAAILLGLSFAPFPFPFLTLVAFVLIFQVVEKSGTTRALILYSFPMLILWNIITTYWLTFATVAGGTAAIVANSAIMLIPLVVMRRILFSSLHPIVKSFTLATPWVAYEWLHLQWDLAWPWITIANAYSTATWAVQYIEFTGYLSISYWSITLSALFYHVLISHNKLKSNLILVTGLAALIPILISLVLLKTHVKEPDGYSYVVVAQPNFDSYLPIAGFPNTFEPLTGLIALSDSARSERTNVILWPENAIMGGISEITPSRNDRLIFETVQKWGIPIVGGASWYQYYLKEEVPRVHRIDFAGRPFNVYNSALGFKTNEDLRVYNKIRLVPIVERFPFVHELSFLTFLGIDWGSLSGYGIGHTMILFDAGDVSFPAVVCYDSVFPSVVRRSVKKGAGFISVITNDGWWGNTSGHIQHYEFARLRAIETRRAVVRSANNGISGMILPDGSPHSRSEYWTRTSFELEVPVYSHQTFYVKSGEWFGWLMLLTSIGTWGLCRIQVLKYQ